MTVRILIQYILRAVNIRGEFISKACSSSCIKVTVTFFGHYRGPYLGLHASEKTYIYIYIYI